MNLLTFACAESLEENFDYGIYYDPTSRNHVKLFSHIGFYSNQAIVGIGEVSKITACDLIGGSIIIQPGFDQTLSAVEKDRIMKTINTSSFNIAVGHKFILVDKVEKTNFLKGTPGPLRWKKYIDLSIYPSIFPTDNTNTVARKLNSLFW